MRVGHKSCGVTVAGKTIRICLADGEPTTRLLVAEIRIEGAGPEGWASSMTRSLSETPAVELTGCLRLRLDGCRRHSDGDGRHIRSDDADFGASHGLGGGIRRLLDEMRPGRPEDAVFGV